jgi:hypothetical protein
MRAQPSGLTRAPHGACVTGAMGMLGRAPAMTASSARAWCRNRRPTPRAASAPRDAADSARAGSAKHACRAGRRSLCDTCARGGRALGPLARPALQMHA